MTTVQKLSLSLLAAVLVFSVFAVVAFSGLFNYIESNFYDPKIRAETEGYLAEAAGKIDRYFDATKKQMAALLANETVRTAYQTNQSQDVLFQRNNLVGKIMEDNESLLFIRLVDRDLKKIHFSTLETDIKQQTKTIREYRLFADVATEEMLNTFRNAFQKNREILFVQVQAAGTSKNEAAAGVLLLPVRDRFDMALGYAFFYFSKRGLAGHLRENGVLSYGERLELYPPDICMLRSPAFPPDAVRNELVKSDGQADSKRGLLEDENGRRYFLFARTAAGGIRISVLEPEDRFVMQLEMKVILLVSVFFTVFLLLFLLLNLRQDAVLVARERVRKFQLQLLHEYVENSETPQALVNLRTALETRKEDVKKEIFRGIGRLRKNKVQEVDEIVDRSWKELLDVLGRSAPVERKTDLDIQKLEAIVEKVVSNLQVLGRAPAGPVPTIGKPGPAKKPVPVEVEELAEADGAEEIEALEEAEEVEEAPAAERKPVEVEEVAEAEGVEELEALEEAEEVEEAPKAARKPVEVEEIAEAEGVEELEALEEAEEAEEAPKAERKPVEVEEVAEAEGVEELEALEEAEEAEEAPAAERKPVEVEEVAEAEGVEELEALEEAEEIEEAPASERKPVEVEELTEAEGVEELEALEEAEEAEETPATDAIESIDMSDAATLEAVGRHSTSGIFGGYKLLSPPFGGTIIELESAAGETIRIRQGRIYTMEDLIESSYVTRFALEDSVRPDETDQNVIENEEGLFRISEGAMAAGPADAAFSRLVRSVIREPESGGPIKESGVDSLFGSSDLGLDGIFSEEKGDGGANRPERKADVREMIKAGSFDFDAYTADFGLEEPGIIKALVNLTRRLKALSAAIWFEEAGIWKIRYKVGINEKSAARMELPLESSLGRQLASLRQALAINWPLEKIGEFADFFSNEASMKNNRLIFLPVLLHETPAYLGIALQQDLDDPKSTVARLLSA